MDPGLYDLVFRKRAWIMDYMILYSGRAHESWII